MGKVERLLGRLKTCSERSREQDRYGIWHCALHSIVVNLCAGHLDKQVQFRGTFENTA